MQIFKKQFWGALLFYMSIIYPFFNVIFSQSQSGNNSITGKSFSLDECLKIALQNNRMYKISNYNLQIAEAQYKQALSTFWPQLSAKTAWTQQDADPFMLFPQSQMAISPLPLFGGELELPPIDVPEQHIKLMNRQNLYGAIEITYPIFTGGLLSSKRTQARYGRDIANYEAQHSDLQVMYDVKKYYYAVVLTEKLSQIGQAALERLEVTLKLTENLYQEGSGRVKKTDYLKNKMVVENIRALTMLLNHNKSIARQALNFSMGLSDTAKVEITDTEIPFTPFTENINQLMNVTYQFNPDWNKLGAAIEIYEAQVKEAKSEYFPKIALFGNLSHLENGYDYGIVSPEMKSTWTVGIGLEIPLFTGFRSINKVRENKTRLNKLKEQKLLFRSGLALQINQIFSQIQTAIDQEKAMKIAHDSAKENRTLTERAYQLELVNEAEMIQSQITESVMQAVYLKVLYDHLEAQCHLNYLIGTEIYRIISE
jgi:outer membrane protein